MMKKNTKPVKIDLKDEAGKRVLLASVRRILVNHQKEIKALENK